MNNIGGESIRAGIRQVGRSGAVVLAGFVFGACAFAQYGQTYPGIALSYAFALLLTGYIGYYSVSAVGFFGEQRTWLYGRPTLRGTVALLAAASAGVWLPAFVLTEHQARIIASVTWTTGQAADSAIYLLVSVGVMVVSAVMTAAVALLVVFALVPQTRRKLRPAIARWRARAQGLSAH
ncbi:hypothetical protein [Mycobacteroides chelonae]|nr:hypothetical protein [Mycobacteroides chelonae]